MLQNLLPFPELLPENPTAPEGSQLGFATIQAEPANAMFDDPNVLHSTAYARVAGYCPLGVGKVAKMRLRLPFSLQLSYASLASNITGATTDNSDRWKQGVLSNPLQITLSATVDVLTPLAEGAVPDDDSPSQKTLALTLHITVEEVWYLSYYQHDSTYLPGPGITTERTKRKSAVLLKKYSATSEFSDSSNPATIFTLTQEEEVGPDRDVNVDTAIGVTDLTSQSHDVFRPHATYTEGQSDTTEVLTSRVGYFLTPEFEWPESLSGHALPNNIEGVLRVTLGAPLSPTRAFAYPMNPVGATLSAYGFPGFAGGWCLAAYGYSSIGHGSFSTVQPPDYDSRWDITANRWRYQSASYETTLAVEVKEYTFAPPYFSGLTFIKFESQVPVNFIPASGGFTFNTQTRFTFVEAQQMAVGSQIFLWLRPDNKTSTARPSAVQFPDGRLVFAVESIGSVVTRSGQFTPEGALSLSIANMSPAARGPSISLTRDGTIVRSTRTAAGAIVLERSSNGGKTWG